MAYFDKYGVEFSDDRKKLVRCPEDFRGEYIIPDGVTDIESDAFKDCNDLSGITIPSSVWMIACGAFENCNGLTSIYIPSNVGCIGGGAFAGCNRLTSIVVDRNNRIYDSRDNCNAIIMTRFHALIVGCRNTILPVSVRSIEGYAFANISELYSIEIPNSSIDSSAFIGCNNLTLVTIGRNVASISAGAFKGCNNLKSIVVKNSNQIYDSRDNCNAIIETKSNTLVCGCNNSTIPNTITSIGNNAFEDCIGLTSITIPNSVINIEENAFKGCTNLTSIEISTNVTIIGYRAFEGCSGLKTINIPNSVTSIGEEAFCGCKNLTSVTIPNSVKSIGERAFLYCTGLTSVEIPMSVVNIEYAAFGDVANIIYVGPATGLPWGARSANGYVDGWFVYRDTTKTQLLACASTAIGDIVIPDSVTSIGDKAFYGCTGLTNVTIPNNVTSIGNFAFSNCIGLTSVNIPNNVTSIGAGAFAYCSNLVSVEIPSSVANIGSEAFATCGNLISLVVDDENIVYDSRNTCNAIIETASNKLIAGCRSSIIPNSVMTIGVFAFKGCSGLTSIIIPDSVVNVEYWAFYNCENLVRIYVPIGQKEYFCKLSGLEEYVDIIQEMSTERNSQREAEEQRLMQEMQMQEMLQGSILFFDTETTGLPPKGMYDASPTKTDIWPRLVQLAWIIADKNDKVVKQKSVIIKPDGFSIPADSVATHGITTERALREGKPLKEVLEKFAFDLSFASQVVGHNIDFDQHIVGAELYRLGMDYDVLMSKSSICTMTSKSIIDYCALPHPDPDHVGYKWPSLSELYRKLFGRSFEDAHDALADITATKECYFELRRRGII